VGSSRRFPGVLPLLKASLGGARIAPWPNAGRPPARASDPANHDWQDRYQSAAKQ
jgi:hypothetical protein